MGAHTIHDIDLIQSDHSLYYLTEKFNLTELNGFICIG